MGFKVELDIPDDSPQGRAIKKIAESEQVSLNEAAGRYFEEQRPLETPQSPMWGLFSSDEDQELLDQIVSEAYRQRKLDVPRTFFDD